MRLSDTCSAQRKMPYVVIAYICAKLTCEP
ncbi:hypothetical protein M3J09_009812 [Ascochyta lentis]